jgi:hypothetical protein
MDRITYSILKNRAAHFNARFGTPTEYWNEETRIINPGHYRIEQGSRYKGIAWKLVQITGEGGGTRVILSDLTARGLFDKLGAYWVGFEACRRHLYKQVGTL